jgi:iron complex outermembrane receptor protein
LDPGHVNVTINGIPLNDSESQLVFWVDLPDILKSTEDIEIQRGLGTSSFGAGDFGASINLNTNKTHIKPYINADAGAGSFGTLKGSVALGTGLMNSRFSLDGRLSYLTSDGFIDRASANLRSFSLSGAYIGLNNSLRLNIINGHEVTYQAWNGVPIGYVKDESLRTYNSAGQEAVKMPGDQPYKDEVDNYSQTHFQLFYNWIKDNSEMSLAAFYTRGKGFFENYRSDQTLKGYNLYPLDTISWDTIHVDDLVTRRWLDNHFYGLNFGWTYNKENWILKSGASVSRYNGDHFGEVIWLSKRGKFKYPFSYYKNDATKLDASAFFKAQWQLGEKLFAYGDIQYRHVAYTYGGGDTDDGPIAERSIEFHFVNPRIGLTYKPTGDLKIYTSVAMSGREPNRDDYVKSSPDNLPVEEKLINTEVGIVYESKKAFWGIYGYIMDYNDQLILTGEISDVGEYARANVDESYRMGIELEAGLSFFDKLHLTANATLSQNKISSFTEFVDNWDTGIQDQTEYTDTDISFSPSVIGFCGVSYVFNEIFPWASEGESLVLEWNHKYVGQQFLDNTSNDDSKLDAYLVADAGLSYSTSIWNIKNVTFRFKVMNLYNELYSSNGWTYRFSSSDTTVIDGDPYARSEGNGIYSLTGLYPQSGTHFLAGLGLKF